MDKTNNFSINLYRKIERDLLCKIGSVDTNFILNKFGRGQSFLKTICLLPRWFYDSFPKNNHKYDFNRLAEANLKAWIGYTIYDYLRDGKIPKGKIIKMISIANIYVHSAVTIFIEQSDSKLKNKYILNLFNKIDLFYINQSNKINIFDNFKSMCSVVHEKSIAAAISAVLVVPDRNNEKTLKNTVDFFKFYFTARQLSDDLDDYKKDIRLKIVTPVTMIKKTGVSQNELKSLVREQIDFNCTEAVKSLKRLEGFDTDFFIRNYMKPC